MAPPKCFFKRPEEFYASGETVIHSPTDYSIHGRSLKETIPKLEPSEIPLDLSYKCHNDSDQSDFLLQLSNFLLQHQHQLPNNNETLSKNQYLNLERLFSHLPQRLQDNEPAPNPIVYVTPAMDDCYRPPRPIDPFHLSVDQAKDNMRRYSPHSVSESGRENSSSETSSQCTGSRHTNRLSKRKIDSKVLRPFKLYKGNDSQGVMEALGINEEDEEWLKSIVEYKSVDDVFLFLTNCMSEVTKPPDLTDDIIAKIQLKFGHIFQNCNTTVSNPKMIRHPDMTPRELKTDEYWEKRRKNNDAAKRSREARRLKEDHLNQHCEKLQSENDNLRREIEKVKQRIDEIKRKNC